MLHHLIHYLNFDRRAETEIKALHVLTLVILYILQSNVLKL